MSVVVEILSWLCIAGGSIWILIGAIGMLRFPDFYTRLHPAGLTDTLGALLLLLGLGIQAGFGLISLKLLIIAVFLLLTSPTSCHATARAAIAAGLKPWTRPEQPSASASADGEEAAR